MRAKFGEPAEREPVEEFDRWGYPQRGINFYVGGGLVRITEVVAAAARGG